MRDGRRSSNLTEFHDQLIDSEVCTCFRRNAFTVAQAFGTHRFPPSGGLLPWRAVARFDRIALPDEDGGDDARIGQSSILTCPGAVSPS